MDSLLIAPKTDRQETRRRTFLGGQIVLHGGATGLDCLVRDMSDQGCRLTISNTIAVPEQFTLRITQDGREFLAVVKWRDDKSIGVEFLGKGEGSVPTAERATPERPR